MATKRRRMTEAEKRALIEAYQSWQPDNGLSAEELAQEHNVTRSAMYSLLRQEGIELKTGRTKTRLHGAEPLMPDMARIALEVILDQLVAAKNEIRDLRARLDECLQQHGGHLAT